MSQPNSDLRRLDLNLLPVFLALMRERNVTRAGAALFLSQPATSAALARLRSLFHDPLFIRNGRALEPTPRAEALAAKLGPALSEVSSAVFGSIPFDPATDDHVFHLGCTEDIALASIPMFRAVRDLAPNCRLVIHAGNFRTIPLLLESGEIGAAFGYMQDDLPATARRRALRRGGYRVLRDASTPGPVDLDMFCSRPHVIVTPRGDLRGFVDPILEQLGRVRRVMAGIPDFALLPRILSGSQLLCTVSELLAEVLVKYETGLVADPPPFSIPESVIHMAWRGSLDLDPAERWIRARIVEHLGRRGDLPDGENRSSAEIMSERF